MLNFLAEQGTTAAAAAQKTMEATGELSLTALAVGLGAGLTIFGAAFGIGKLASSAMEAMGRQPEAAGKIQTAMIIAAALIEGATLFALVIFFLMGGKV